MCVEDFIFNRSQSYPKCSKDTKYLWLNIEEVVVSLITRDQKCKEKKHPASHSFDEETKLKLYALT